MGTEIKNEEHELPPVTTMHFWPQHDELRLLPKHGEPLCIVEWMSQAAVKAAVWLPTYIAIVVTLMALVQFGIIPIPWLK